MALPIAEAAVGDKERLDLCLDRLHQHPPRPLAQHRQERIIGEGRAWLGQRDNGTFLHGVSFLVT